MKMDCMETYVVSSGTQLAHLSDFAACYHVREKVHQVGRILFQTNFIITRLAMFYLLLRFDHHRRPSSGTECSVVTARWMDNLLATPSSEQ